MIAKMDKQLVLDVKKKIALVNILYSRNFFK